jgi:hypothetical protein
MNASATRIDLTPDVTIQDDVVEVNLPGLTISLKRKQTLEIPHEVSVIIPRAEIRLKEHEMELIYSSITVVHAPRHPLAGEPSAIDRVSADTKPSPASHDVKPPPIRFIYSK